MTRERMESPWHVRKVDSIRSWETSRGKQFGKCDTDPGWYVGFKDPSRDYSLFIPLRFGRKIDAERSVATLRARMPAQTTKELIKKIDEIGPYEFRKLMVENLAW